MKVGRIQESFLHFGHLLEPVVEFWQFRIYLFSLKAGELIWAILFKNTQLNVSKSFFFQFLNFNPKKLRLWTSWEFEEANCKIPQNKILMENDFSRYSSSIRNFPNTWMRNVGGLLLLLDNCTNFFIKLTLSLSDSQFSNWQTNPSTIIS